MRKKKKFNAKIFSNDPRKKGGSHSATDTPQGCDKFPFFAVLRLKSLPPTQHIFMPENQASQITRILQDWNNGDEHAKEQLLPFVYDELKRQARILMSSERSNHTLQPTALVHEAFLKLGRQTGIEWKNRSHFFGIASRLMRQILIDHARLHATAKRGNRPIHFSLDDVNVPIVERADALIALDDALARLEKLDEQQAKVVEMRFFGGMTNSEIAESLDISERTVVRDWQAARLWLYRELSNG
jgi:RNA polymerase sigma factor (TIGR02999 family)